MSNSVTYIGRGAGAGPSVVKGFMLQLARPFILDVDDLFDDERRENTTGDCRHSALSSQRILFTVKIYRILLVKSRQKPTAKRKIF